MLTTMQQFLSKQINIHSTVNIIEDHCLELVTWVFIVLLSVMYEAQSRYALCIHHFIKCYDIFIIFKTKVYNLYHSNDDKLASGGK